MDLKIIPIQSISNFKQNTTAKEETKKKSPVSFAEILKDAMKK
ncbi:hypothetical protein SOV_22780 [Sporomusa ovata DSM 2662]|uniref:Uncharacterized protein n=1 Tax=Sporomusa ovata TaxID=2378 RepID=A0A0U1L3B5_9FIRM|nr:hypothetical protein [Sporomusa ovata]EQB25594.1 hypothetical protein SOV_4c02570 [Sporomusa ovata DSM 2662]CQR74150.1 hypothetical protein SpAn4DRAFT_0612 [Sporomusa ovata]